MISLETAIENAHPNPEWACFFEVRDNAGYQSRRSADAIAMSLWPSRGLTIRGFEIKRTLSDYKNEAKDPEKAETIAKYCDEWYIVTPKGLIKDINLELPPAWGLMELDDKGKLHTTKKAVTTEATPITRGFLAAILRRAACCIAERNNGWIRKENIQEEINNAVEFNIRHQIPTHIQNIKDDNDRMKKVFSDFKQITNIDIEKDQWRENGKDIGTRCKVGEAILGRYNNNIKDINRHFRTIESILKEMRKRLNESIESTELNNNELKLEE